MITRAILEILDFRSNSLVVSNNELDLSLETVYEYVNETLAKVEKNPSGRKGQFNEGSKVIPLLNSYKSKEIDFIKITSKITNDLVSLLTSQDEKKSLDIMFIEYHNKEEDYLAIIFLENKEALMHYVEQKDGRISNLIIKNFAILPTSSVNLSTFALINLNELSLFSLEKARLIDKEPHKVLEEYLDTTYEMSNNETYRIIKNVVNSVASNNDINPTLAITRAKSYLASKGEVKELPCEEIAEHVFDSTLAKDEFNASMHNKGLFNNINLDHSYLMKKTLTHKIKTDTGIEIIFPSNNFDNEDNLEFINEPDGTISIRIKNIGKIINR